MNFESRTSSPLPVDASDTLPLPQEVEEEGDGLAADEVLLSTDGTVDGADTASGDSYTPPPAGVGVDASTDE